MAVWLPLVIANSDVVLWGLSGIIKIMGLGGTSGYIALNLFGFLILALIGWLLLRLLGRRYRQIAHDLQSSNTVLHPSLHHCLHLRWLVG